jgi:hypothetical protein
MKSGLCFGKDADDFLGFAEFLVVDNAIQSRKECVVSTNANIRARLKLCSPLTHKDASCTDGFTTEPFDTKSLGIAISPVA